MIRKIVEYALYTAGGFYAVTALIRLLMDVGVLT